MGTPSGHSTERCWQTGKSRERTTLLLVAGQGLPGQAFRDFSRPRTLSLSRARGWRCLRGYRCHSRLYNRVCMQLLSVIALWHVGVFRSLELNGVGPFGVSVVRK